MWLALWLPLPAAAQALLAVPPLKSRVTDVAGVLEPAAREALERRLADFEQARGTQVAVLLVASTRPEPIEDYAHRVGETWKIGRKGVGDGLLVVVARDDKRVRIDVARALEGAIPDLEARRVIREQMAPRFGQGDFAGGLEAGLGALFALIEREALPAPSGRAAPPENNDLEGWLMLGFIALIVGGSILKALFGRAGGSALGAGGAGVIAWLVAGSLWVAAAVALAALVFLLVMGGGRGARMLPGVGGGGFGGGFGGHGGGDSWGGFSSGGGGDFGGGGASGGWGGGDD
ncbi:MAG: TPM domain-containing protein [Burkholderiales bacterium]|nr:TPM domain-containing protein [Burkholderiales bacterium]